MPPKPHRRSVRSLTPEYEGRRADAARWIRDTLRQQILDGAFGGLAAPRPMLPTETALAAQMGVSRNAVRGALDLLRAEGLVTRIPGAGTFVTGAKLRQHLDRLEGLAESMAGHQLPVVNRVLAARMAAATLFVARQLAVAEGSEVVFVERLRSVGGVPLSVETSYLRPAAGRVLLGNDLARTDIFALLERHLGHRLSRAEVTIEAVPADDTVAELLQVRAGSPLLLLQRLTFLDADSPFDLEAIRYRADRLQLVTTLSRDLPGSADSSTTTPPPDPGVAGND
ncbi:GntR family transcriptional regulator [Acidiferrimicrobium sp. IK]|uniref:GntR family transcriptional regulator n=1 Tax=Acidiferrimicrobium sp. IK TaxID=2871700 RepID=UPI0021CB8545|nr:GntR family transcriptional regulator [Acidiferrimicrobium sp. IK]MCU4183245.1 GntR family transcriptional regulator [Acidiferrimicrobium sp. IK]